VPLRPIPLQTRRLPFDDPNWVFELKYDGFRALAIADRRPELLSRNGHPFGSFADLAKQIAEHLASNTVLMGIEIELISTDRLYALAFPRDGCLSAAWLCRSYFNKLL
jgi:ATP-dependent DNA ligase